MRKLLFDSEEELSKVKSEMERVKNLNEKWQDTALNKCEMIASKS